MSKPRERRVAGAPGADEEWMVGRVSLPVYVAEPEPFRPDMVLCVSQAGVLGATTVDPDASDDDAADTVVAFSRAPMVGPPRRPRLIRVASPGLREALARRLGEGVAITLAATPEIDALAERFVADFQEKPRRSKGAGDGGASYLSGGRIDPELARGLFDAAARLYEAAPWTVVPSDTDVLALDVPSLGAEGLCVSVIGQMGENLGVVVFASRGDFGRFLAATARGAHGAFGAPTLHVGFERLPALPPRMRDEIAKHGWKCVGPSLAPVPIRADADGLPRLLVADDYVLGRIVAAGVARFCERHRTWPSPGAEPIVERIVLDDVPGRPEVVLTAAPRSTPPPRAPRPRPPAAAAALRDLRGVRPTTELAVKRVCGELWGEEFARRFSGELEEAIVEVCAAAGSEAAPEELQETMGSLPLVWTALWRPMQDGRTGVSLARSWKKLGAPVLAAAVARLEAARGVLAEVVSVTASGRVLLRDLFDGTIYRVDFPDAPRKKLTRWTRVFTVLVDLGDGSWTFPSILQSMPGALALEPRAMLETARDALRELGVDPDEIDPRAPHAGLTRWSGLAAAALFHLPAPEPEGERKRRYLVNGDGERAEFHDAELRLSKAARARLLAALPSAAGVTQVGSARFEWLGSPSSAAPYGETKGTLELASKPRLHADSRERYARLLASIAELAGEQPELEKLSQVRPWETSDDFAEQEGPDTERVLIAVGVVKARGAPARPEELLLDGMRWTLDETVPALGGAPRALAATEAGRAAVEAWLREAEVRGVPQGGGASAFLDLDPLREELGLPTVAGELGRS